MPKLILGLLLLLGACAAPPPSETAYRDARAQIYSNPAFEPSRFAGRWHEVAGFFDPARQSCALGLTDAAARGDGGLTLTLAGCAGRGAGTVAATRIKPGRYLPAGGAEPWWVLWVAEDYRTAVIGTPSGHFGAILSRDATVSPDRLRAAREILDFNAYDVKRLVVER